MPATFTLIADPSPRAIAKQLRSLGREFRSWRPAWHAAAPLVARGLHDNVLRRGSTIGETWAPLKAATERRKARLGRNRGPLIGTGASILDPLAGGSARVVLTASKMKIGVPGVAANVQHFGSEKRRIPARRFMDWSPPMEAAVKTAMDLHARKLIADALAKMNAAVRR